jgi:DNA-binding SARP family transcriptional activator
MAQRECCVSRCAPAGDVEGLVIELRTLGTIELLDEAGQRIESVLLRSKRLALLAYLCTSNPVRLWRRDILVALLWPELDNAHARGALRFELSRLRRALGCETLCGEGTDAIGVNPERIWCDASAFDAALDGGTLEAALELWRGDFLPGLHVPGGEFERWLDGMRDRLARRAVDAADQLRARAEERGDFAHAVRWARRGTELVPYNETAWRHLLSSLDRAGDRAGALAAYNALAIYLRDEFEVEPSPETGALAERIRGRLVVPADLVAGGRPGDDGAVPPVRRETTADCLPPRPAVIALRPVENLTGDARHDALGHRLTDRLMHGIADLGFAEAFMGEGVGGVTVAVSTALHARSVCVEVRTRLAEPAGAGRILFVPEPVLLDPEAEDDGLDVVVARVLASLAAHYHPDMPMLAASGRPALMPSWQAFLEYERGSEAFGAFRFQEAVHRLRRAHEIDPRLLKAAIFASLAMAFAGDAAGADAYATAAMRDAASASEYERHFGEWFLAFLHGRRPEAYRAATEMTRLVSHPVPRVMASTEALYMNRPAEALRLLPPLPFEWGWWRHWAWAYDVAGWAFHALEDHRGELDTVLRGRQRYPGSLEVIRAETRARAALGEETATLGLVEEALTLPPPEAPRAERPEKVSTGMVSPADVAWTAAQELESHGHDDAAVAARHAGLAWLSRHDAATRADRLLQARLLLELGDVHAARQHMDALGPVEDIEALGLAALLAASTGDTATACEALAQLESLRNPYACGRHLLHAAGVRVALNQPQLAVDTLRRALAAGLPFSVELHALPILRPLRTRPDFAALHRPRG